MSDTLIPTMTLRWSKERGGARSGGVVLEERNWSLYLQQLFETPGGKKIWKDVPIVYKPDELNGQGRK